MNTLLLREWQCIYRQLSLYLAPAIYYLIILTIFPMLMNMHQSALHNMIATLIWIALSLSFMTIMPHLYWKDHRSGILAQIKLARGDLKTYLRVKLIVTWIAVFTPILIIFPIIAIMYDLSLNQVFALCLSILTGGILLTGMGMLLMATAIGLETQPAMLAVMYVPLLMPIMITGASVLDPITGKICLQVLVGSALALLSLIAPLCNYLLQVMLYE